MTERNWLEKAGASPAKLAMVGVLALALTAVIWHNVSGTAQPIEMRPETAPPTEVVKEAVKPAATNDKQVVQQIHRDWPEIALANVVKHDPFAMPIWYLAAQADDNAAAGGLLARSAQVIEELKKVQSRIVVITAEDRMAMLGDLSLREGDTIEGFQVTKITTEEIVLTELPR
jgi:hypothetical protein